MNDLTSYPLDADRLDAATDADAPAYDDVTPSEAFAAMVTDNPLPSVLAAAAVGAGLMALASLMVAPSRPSVASVGRKAQKAAQKAAEQAAENARDEADSLRSQLADLAKGVLATFSAALPSKADVRKQAADAADAADDARSSLASYAGTARETLADTLKSARGTLKSAGANVADSAGSSLKSAGDSIRSLLGDTLGQAGDVLQKYQPQVDAVTKLARQNPLWATLIAGAAGTLIGWQLLGSKDDR